jgi:hypothetical protein
MITRAIPKTFMILTVITVVLFNLRGWMGGQYLMKF